MPVKKHQYKQYCIENLHHKYIFSHHLEVAPCFAECLHTLKKICHVFCTGHMGFQNFFNNNFRAYSTFTVDCGASSLRLAPIIIFMIPHCYSLVYSECIYNTTGIYLSIHSSKQHKLVTNDMCKNINFFYHPKNNNNNNYCL